MKKAFDTFATIMVVVAASAVLYNQFLRPAPEAPERQATVTTVEQTLPASFLTNTMGTGETVIVEMTDFQCPFCADHSQNGLPALKKEFVDTGKVTYAVLNLPLPMHAQAETAAVAAECAAKQGKYWEMHDRLFQKQKELATVDFTSLGDGLVDPSEFKTCVESDSVKAKVKADQKEALRIGAKSTPTFFVGKKNADGSVALKNQVLGSKTLAAFIAQGV